MSPEEIKIPVEVGGSTLLLEEAFEVFDKQSPKLGTPEFRLWWYQWIQKVHCELNPDPWMDEPLTQEEEELFVACAREGEE